LGGNLKELFDISGLWMRNVGNRHDAKRQIQQLNRRIIARLKGPLTRRKSERGFSALRRK